MPFCPQCRAEYQEWATVCSDCKVQLVNELTPPPKIKTTSERLARVAIAPNEPIGLMWAEILKNEGINSLTKQGDIALIMQMPNIQPDCRIYVLASQAQKAREILAPFVNGIEGG